MNWRTASRARSSGNRWSSVEGTAKRTPENSAGELAGVRVVFGWVHLSFRVSRSRNSARMGLGQQLEPFHLAPSFVSTENHRLNEVAEESHPPRPICFRHELDAGTFIFGCEPRDRVESKAQKGVGSRSVLSRASSLQDRRISDQRP